MPTGYMHRRSGDMSYQVAPFTASLTFSLASKLLSFKMFQAQQLSFTMCFAFVLGFYMLLRFTSCRASRFKGQTSQATQCWFSKHSCRHSSGVAGEVLRMWSPRPLRQQTQNDPKGPVTTQYLKELKEGLYFQRLLRHKDRTDGGEREALIARLPRPCKATHRKVQQSPQSPLSQQGAQAFDVTEIGVSTSECQHTKIQQSSSSYRNSSTES